MRSKDHWCVLTLPPKAVRAKIHNSISYCFSMCFWYHWCQSEKFCPTAAHNQILFWRSFWYVICICCDAYFDLHDREKVRSWNWETCSDCSICSNVCIIPRKITLHHRPHMHKDTRITTYSSWHCTKNLCFTSYTYDTIHLLHNVMRYISYPLHYRIR